MKARSSRLIPYRRIILHVLRLEFHVDEFAGMHLCAFQESRGCGTGRGHNHVGVRLIIDREDQKVRAGSWATLMRVMVHQHQLERRSAARLMQGGAI